MAGSQHHHQLILQHIFGHEEDCKLPLDDRIMKRRQPPSVSSLSVLPSLLILNFDLLLLLLSSSHISHALSTSSSSSPATTSRTAVAGRAVHKTHLNPSDALHSESMTKSSPFTYSIASILDLDSSKDNFLATQVWPSARVAAQALLKYNPYNESKQWKMCEFGCGPGLPSLAAAHTNHYSQVVATDVDEFCLELVQAAAEDQGLGDIVKTQVLDLTRDPADLLLIDDDVKSLENQFSGSMKVDMADEHSPLPSLSYDWIKDIDLFVMADIFENAQVAKGAAVWTKFLLHDLRRNDRSARDNEALAKNTNIGEQSSTNQNTKGRKALEKRPRIWVFAQSDRAQREIYLESLREVYDAQDLKWLPLDECSEDSYLWLVDLEETEVQYG